MVENKKLAVAQQQSMSFKKGQLIVNNEPYKKKIAIPNTRKMLKMEEPDLVDLKEITVSGRYSETEGGSHFVAYATKVRSLQEVRKCYLHMRRLHADANHVTMAYRLPSLDKAHNEDYLDDREVNAGRRILHKLIEKQVDSIAVFVIRYYGRKHIGAKRFEIHQRLVEKCLKDMTDEVSFTSKLSLRQFDDRKLKKKNKKKHLPKPHPPFPAAMGTIRGAAPQTHFASSNMTSPSATYNRFMLLQQSSESSYSAEESDYQGFTTTVRGDARLFNQKADVETNPDNTLANNSNIQSSPTYAEMASCPST